MSAMRESRANRPLRDPAPSRVRYRLTRWWLSPVIRRFVTTIIPLAGIAAGAFLYLSQPKQQEIIWAWGDEVLQSIEARPEFQVRLMSVTGASPVLADAIRERVGLEFPVSWFDLDADVIHARVSQLDAVEDVRVTVDLGGALRLQVSQRVPAVIWRTNAGLEMLDATGHRIAYIDHREGRPDLPLITGEGAQFAVPEALALSTALAPLGDRLRGLTRRGERRWDVVLDRDQVIRLPEENPIAALERTLAMDVAMDLLGRDVPVVDMRFPERPVVQLNEQAMESLRLTRAFEMGLSNQ